MPRPNDMMAKFKGKRRPDNFFKTLARLLSYYKNCKLQLILAVVFIIIYSLSVIIAGYQVKGLTVILEQALADKAGIQMDHQIASYTAILIYMGALYLLSVLTNYALNRLMLQCT